MGKKTYGFIRLLDPGRIILGDKKAFGKNKQHYDNLQERLKDEWSSRSRFLPETQDKKFVPGQHVLVKSARFDGIRRGIIHGGLSALNDWCYSVFLYDEGAMDDVEETCVSPLSEEHQQQLEPRTVIVRLTGIVPAKVVELTCFSMQQNSSGGVKTSVIVTQDTSWSNKAVRLVNEWLSDKNVRYFGVEITKTNPDCSVYGDVYRKLQLRAFQSENDDTGAGEVRVEGEGVPKEKEKFFLSAYILNEKLGMRNGDLADSQLKARGQPSEPWKLQNAIRTEQCDKSGNQGQKPTDVSSKGNNDDDTLTSNTTESLEPDYSEECDEELLALMRQNSMGVPLTSSCRRRLSQENSDPGNGDSELENSIQLTDASQSCQSSNIPTLVPKSHNINAWDSGEKENFNIPGRLLVRGRRIYPPYKSRSEFMLPSSVMKALDALNHCDLSDLHKIVAPNFKRGADMIIIAADAGSAKGKRIRALSYILPVLRLVYSKYTKINAIDKDEPPETLIIVNSYNTGKDMETYISELLTFKQEQPLTVKFLTADESELRVKKKQPAIPGAIGILIITITHLAALMQTKDGPYLFKKLQFLIFEELDMYVKTHRESILIFVEAARANVYVSTKSVPFQVTFSGAKWTEEVESLYKEVVEDRVPVLVINHPIQVIRYAQIKWKVELVRKENDRLKQLSDLLRTKDAMKHERTVIACSTTEVGKAIYDFIRNKTEKQVLFYAYENNSFHDIPTLWARNCSNILIIPDIMPLMPKFSNATLLICYDSPVADSKPSAASERFAYLWAHIRHIEMEHVPGAMTEITAESKKLTAHFLMSGKERNFHQLYKFTSVLPNVEFAPELKALGEAMDNAGLAGVKLCDGVKLFGYCMYSEPGYCSCRHVFLPEELSNPTATPLSGELEVLILRAKNPSQYQAKLLRHYSFEKQNRVCTKNYIAEEMKRKREMAKFYSAVIQKELEDGDNNKPFRLPTYELEAWCAVRCQKETGKNEEYFQRAKIDRIGLKDKLGLPSSVRVYCVDSGALLNPSVEDVFKLKEEYQKWRPLVVELVLSNLKPGKCELEYRVSSVAKAKRYFEEKILQARICLAVENTVWVNPMVEYHRDPINGSFVKGDSARLVLIHDRIADFNGTHLDALVELIQRHPGLYKGETEIFVHTDDMDFVKKEFHQFGDGFRWAHVEKSNGGTPIKMDLEYGYDPWLFFGSNEKYYDQRTSLEKELSNIIQGYIEGSDENQRFVNYTKLFKNYYEPGMVVAVKDRIDEGWIRGLIQATYVIDTEEDMNQTEKSLGTTYEIFFVDYGETCHDVTLEEIFPIPKRLVKQLPFQAIALKLDHVTPLVESGWDEAAINELLDTILPSGLALAVDIVAYEDEVVSTDLSLPCRYYKAVVFGDSFELGSNLVEKGLANWIVGKKCFVQSIQDNYLNYLNHLVAVQAPNDDVAWEADAINHVNKKGTHEDLPEDFDINVDFRDVEELFGPFLDLKNKIGYPLSDIGSTKSPKEPSPPKPLHNAQAEPVPSTSKASSSVKLPFDPPKVEPKSPFSDLLHPQVLWRQDEQSLTFTIVLPDVKEYDLKVLSDGTTVEFKTLDKTPNYGFTVKVMARLLPNFTPYITGQFMRVTFRKKLQKICWPRLLSDKKEKLKWLKQEFLGDASEDEEHDGDDTTWDDLRRHNKMLISQFNTMDEEDDEELEYDDELGHLDDMFDAPDSDSDSDDD